MVLGGPEQQRVQEAGDPERGDVLIGELEPLGSGVHHLAPPASVPIIGGYHLVARFPSSPTSQVFLAHRPLSHGLVRRVVVKWADRRSPSFDRSSAALKDEARALAFLDHPNITALLDVGEDASGAFLVLEYVRGSDLAHVVSALRGRNQRLPTELVSWITVEALRGLQHAHTATGPDRRWLRLIHRDVNPSNIIVSTEGHVKLTDFGVVRMMGRTQATTEPHMVKGKFRYMAPEYISNDQLSPRSDIYSVGVMLLELLTGGLCFEGPKPLKIMQRIVNEGPPYELLAAAQVPADLEQVVRCATARAPTDRYSSAREMCGALETHLARNRVYVSASVMADFMFTQHLGPS